MDFDLGTVLVFVTGVLAGAIAALKVIAPRTKTKTDDKVLEYAEKAKDVLDLLPKPAPAPVAREAVEVKTVSGFDPKANVRDHR